ncbi:MAG TPA: transcription antitermination factor NusB [Bryobacteraceae bacterium]
MPVPAPARRLAFDILQDVERGGYASDRLAARSAGIDGRDAGLASTIVFGVLRYRAPLDWLIRHFSGRSSKLDPEVRTVLRMAVFQLRHLERVPPHAVVADAVELVKCAHKRSAAGFVNAVLRKVDRSPVVWPDRETELSCPEWLLARWERHYDAETTRGIALAALAEPEHYVRVPAGATPPAEAVPTEIPGCYRLAGQGTHAFRRQDIGSQSIVPLLRLEPGHRFLDLCAAPGNKTAQALESGAPAIACDFHLHRLAQLKSLGTPLLVLDGTQPLPFAGAFDRILVDAPCSGTGTLARNPEIKWRLTPADLGDLHRRQSALLANARAALAPGGLLVYSTCSLEAEENEEVVAAVPPELVVGTMRRIPGRQPGDGFYAAVIKSEKPAND